MKEPCIQRINTKQNNTNTNTNNKNNVTLSQGIQEDSRGLNSFKVGSRNGDQISNDKSISKDESMKSKL